ncbi:MAG: NlpC/P60 family protein [Actinobacteria bacterium]|nr:NlpC/P60 family protein [Actinomycetota bacterium]MCA1721723.1 NlpC/P60 family protein [Actinomycetota bacterium]
MLSTKHARHARAPYVARHARPSQAPARVAAASAVGGLLIPLAASTPAYASEQQSGAVRVSGPGHAVQPGAAGVTIRLLSDGHYLNGQPVEVQIPEGSGWRTIAKASTTSDGLAHTTVSVTRDTRVRAHFRGSEATTAATSSSVVIDVENFGQRVLAEARRHNGAPYRYGAVGPSAFDCSGFTRYVFGRLGKSLPHNASAQRSAAQPISRANARPGDLVFMDGNGHVGIYAGDGMMWDAPRAGKNVSLRRIYSSTYAVGRIA